MPEQNVLEGAPSFAGCACLPRAGEGWVLRCYAPISLRSLFCNIKTSRHPERSFRLPTAGRREGPQPRVLFPNSPFPPRPSVSSVVNLLPFLLPSGFLSQSLAFHFSFSACYLPFIRKICTHHPQEQRDARSRTLQAS